MSGGPALPRVADSRRKRALQEAAHAVIARALGLLVVHVNLERAQIAHPRDGSLDTAIKRIVTAFADHEAVRYFAQREPEIAATLLPAPPLDDLDMDELQERTRPTSAFYGREEGDDNDVAEKVALEACAGDWHEADRLLEFCYSRTKRLVAEHAEQIDELAQQLLRDGEYTPEDE